MITIVWFASVAMFIAAVAKHGWGQLPRWRRYYAMAAAPVALLVWLLVDRNLPVPIPEALVTPLAGALFGAWMIVVWVGVVIGVSQALRFNSGYSIAVRSAMQPAPPTSRPAVVQCWSCKAPLAVTEENRGTNVKCSRCGVKQTLPA